MFFGWKAPLMRLYFFAAGPSSEVVCEGERLRRLRSAVATTETMSLATSCGSGGRRVSVSCAFGSCDSVSFASGVFFEDSTVGCDGGEWLGGSPYRMDHAQLSNRHLSY